MNDIETAKGEIVMYQPDETIRLEVRMDGETVWLNQQQMAELFATDRTSIAKHILNVYETDELEKEPTCAKIAQVRQEGNRKVKRNIVYYNLDVIISVGYRVNSKRGTKFRQWANKVLKEYLLKGYVIDTRIRALENQISEQGFQIRDLQNKVNFFVRSSLPPVEGIFYDGQISPITIYTCRHNHDRFLIIDDVVYIFGASLKDAGKKLFAYIQMQETSASDLLNLIR